MQDMDMKEKILQEIMDAMDKRDGEQLKSHPKFMAAKVEVAKPEMGDDEDKDPSMDDMESSEVPVDDEADQMKSKVSGDDEEMDPEMIEKLIEMMNGK